MVRPKLPTQIEEGHPGGGEYYLPTPPRSEKGGKRKIRRRKTQKRMR